MGAPAAPTPRARARRPGPAPESIGWAWRPSLDDSDENNARGQGECLHRTAKRMRRMSRVLPGQMDPREYESEQQLGMTEKIGGL